MIKYKDYLAGWLNSSIHDFLEATPLKSSKARYALITCLDSNLNPSSLRDRAQEIEPLLSVAQSLGSGLLVSTKRLMEFRSSTRIFFGFDEIFFFKNRITEPKPDLAWLIGPARADQQTMDRLGQWMLANDCTLALGDGEGLNVIVKARGLVRYLIGHSLNQPSPSSLYVPKVEEQTEQQAAAEIA
jgi:hypothetical protein